MFILSCCFPRSPTKIFFFLKALWKLRKAVELNCYVSPLWVKGIQGTQDSPGRYPCMSASAPHCREHPKGWQDHSLFFKDSGTHFWEGHSPTGVNVFMKRTSHSPTSMTPESPKEEDSAPEALPMHIGPAEAISGPLRSFKLLVNLPKGSAVHCCITLLTFPTGVFKCINLKAVSKEYAYRDCDKTSFNWDTMVSH